MTGRQRVSSGGHWEPRIGYSRAIVVGDSCWVSGTTDAGPDGHSRHPGDPAAQARAALEVIGAALAEAGFSFRDVVRTRMFITDAAHGDAVGAVHGEVFGDVRPASSMLVIKGFIEPSLLVEIEVDAVRGPDSSQGSGRGSG
jgi:enamine deaminase RidA (YjgF/YER057c/UK114 family)